MPVSGVSSSSAVDQQQGANSVFPKKDAQSFPGMKKKDDSSNAKATGKTQLTPDQQKEVDKLKKRDADVRAHEQAHVAVGGAYIKGGINYSYEKGPDGAMYAVGGEVSIDTSAVKGDPQATISKMEVVKAAALAPADPSGADRAVAAEAQEEEAQAQQELLKQKTGKAQGEDFGAPSTGSAPTASYSFHGQKSANVNPMSRLINIVA
jgi:SprA-related family